MYVFSSLLGERGCVFFQIVRILVRGIRGQWSRIRGPIIDYWENRGHVAEDRASSRASSRLENEEGPRDATVSRLLYLLDRIGCCRRVVNRAQPDETSRRVLPCFQRFVACWGSSPFIGISAHSIMGIIKEMG